MIGVNQNSGFFKKAFHINISPHYFELLASEKMGADTMQW